MDGAVGPSGQSCALPLEVLLILSVMLFLMLPGGLLQHLLILQALLCYLIALDKHPGVGPIEVGEVCWWLLSKAILCVIRSDVLQAAGPLRL